MLTINQTKLQKEKSLMGITLSYTLSMIDLDTINNILVSELKQEEKIIVLEGLSNERISKILTNLGVKKEFLETIERSEL